MDTIRQNEDNFHKINKLCRSAAIVLIIFGALFTAVCHNKVAEKYDSAISQTERADDIKNAALKMSAAKNNLSDDKISFIKHSIAAFDKNFDSAVKNYDTVELFISKSKYFLKKAVNKPYEFFGGNPPYTYDES